MSGGPCGSDEGNLQVGWWKKNEKEKSLFPFTANLKKDKLNNKVTKNNKSENSGNNKNDMNDNDNDTDDDEYQAVQPVFMDIWRKEYVQKYDNENAKKLKKIEVTVIPRTALYVREKNMFGVYKRVYITRNFDAKDSETGAARDNYDNEFLNYDKERDIYFDNSLTKNNYYNNDNNGNNDNDDNNDINIGQANRFLRIEDIPAWEKGQNPSGTFPHITSPLGGSLVLFDSVCLPHEVMETIKGERLVLAGWFHENQQPVANWFNMLS